MQQEQISALIGLLMVMVVCGGFLGLPFLLILYSIFDFSSISSYNIWIVIFFSYFAGFGIISLTTFLCYGVLKMARLFRNQYIYNDVIEII